MFIAIQNTATKLFVGFKELYISNPIVVSLASKNNKKADSASVWAAIQAAGKTVERKDIDVGVNLDNWIQSVSRTCVTDSTDWISITAEQLGDLVRRDILQIRVGETLFPILFLCFEGCGGKGCG